MTFDVSLIKENLVVLPFQQTNIQTNRMTPTDIEAKIGRKRQKKVIVIVVVVSVVVTAEHTTPPPENPEKIYRRFISVPLVYTFDQRMGGERLRGAGRLGLSYNLPKNHSASLCINPLHYDLRMYYIANLSLGCLGTKPFAQILNA